MTAPAAHGSDVRTLVRRYWPLLGLSIAVVLISIASRHLMFPAYSWNRDEPVYLWQMEALRAGLFTTTDGGMPEFFRPWLTAAEDGVFFSQYTLGWPLVLLAADLAFGSPDAALAFGAILTVLGTYALARELTEDHPLALVAAAVMTLSPIVAIQGGVYLGYLFTLGLGLLFAAALLSGVRRRRPIRVVAGGLMLGWIFLTRPFDAVLWGVAVVGYLTFVRRREWRRLLGAAGWLALGLVPLVVATLAYNRSVTGSLTQFPITAADPLDTYGFGFRRIMPAFGRVHYDFGKAVFGTAKNAGWLPLFLVGSYVGVVVAAVGLWLRRRDQSTLALLAIGAVFPVGYFAFWGMHISSLTAKLSGPIYYIPIYAPLSILIAAAIVGAWRRRPAQGVALVAVLALTSVPFAINRFDVNRTISEAQIGWKDGADSIDGRALVFVSASESYLLFRNPYSANGPDLDDRVLYAVDRGPANLELIEAMPDRTPYLQRTSKVVLRPRPTERRPTVSVRQLSVLEGGVVSLRVQVTNTPGSPAVAAYLKFGDHIEWRTLATDATAGAVYETEWKVGVPSAAEGADDDPVLPLASRLGLGRGFVVAGAGFGASEDVARTTPAVRQVFPYRIDDSKVELLLPPEKTREVTQRGRRTWRLAMSPPELDVTATIDS